MKVFSQLDRQIRRNLLVLFGSGLLFWSSLAALLPTLPLYIEDIGATEQQIGIVMGCFAIGLLLLRASLGKLADRRSRKIVLLIGMAVAAIAPLGYTVVQSIPLLMVLRAFHGISIAAFTTGYSALVADIAPSQNRGEVIGYMSLVNPIGVAIGPALGGYLQAWAGYTPLFLLSSGLGVLGLICTTQILKPPVSATRPVAKDQQFWQLLFSPRLQIPAIVLMMVGLTFGTIATFIPLFIKSTEAELNPGLFYTAAAIASFSARLFAGRASDQYGRGLFVTISLLFYTSSMLLLWTLADRAEIFLLAAILEGTGAGILIPMMATIVADRSVPQERGKMFGVCMVGFDLGIAIAGPVFGSVAEQLGYANMFGVAGSLTTLAFVIFLTRSSKDLPHSFRFALGRGRDIYAVSE